MLFSFLLKKLIKRLGQDLEIAIRNGDLKMLLENSPFHNRPTTNTIFYAFVFCTISLFGAKIGHFIFNVHTIRFFKTSFLLCAGYIWSIYDLVFIPFMYKIVIKVLGLQESEFFKRNVISNPIDNSIMLYVLCLKLIILTID